MVGMLTRKEIDIGKLIAFIPHKYPIITFFFSCDRLHGDNGKELLHIIFPAITDVLPYTIYQKSQWNFQLYGFYWTFTLHVMGLHCFVLYTCPSSTLFDHKVVFNADFSCNIQIRVLFYLVLGKKMKMQKSFHSWNPTSFCWVHWPWEDGAQNLPKIVASWFFFVYLSSDSWLIITGKPCWFLTYPPDL